MKKNEMAQRDNPVKEKFGGGVRGGEMVVVVAVPAAAVAEVVERAALTTRQGGQ